MLSNNRLIDASWRRLWLIRDGFAEHAKDNGTYTDDVAAGLRAAMSAGTAGADVEHRHNQIDKALHEVAMKHGLERRIPRPESRTMRNLQRVST